MANIISFPGDPYGDVPVSDVLDGEKVRKAKQIIIIGYDEEDEFFLCMSDGRISPNLVLVELAQRVFLRELEAHHGLY